MNYINNKTKPTAPIKRTKNNNIKINQQCEKLMEIKSEYDLDT